MSVSKESMGVALENTAFIIVVALLLWGGWLISISSKQRLQEERQAEEQYEEKIRLFWQEKLKKEELERMSELQDKDKTVKKANPSINDLRKKNNKKTGRKRQ